ncbi:hypothetical protein LQZ19_05450 [Treponema primitia]|uniref:hypothetical protein n=1 Tax=Treponema primitia TaxID=88058 RepID=UPI003980275D
MNEIKLFGVKWNRETYDPIRYPLLYVLSLITIIKYTNNEGDYCFITNDVVTLIPYSDSFKWNINNKKILTEIKKGAVEKKPLFLCFGEQKESLERTFNYADFEDHVLKTADEIFDKTEDKSY